MKRNYAICLSGAMAVVCLAGTQSFAQDQAIADQDLLNMMESVNEEQPAVVEELAVEETTPVVEEVSVAEDVAVVEEVVVEDVVSATDANTVVDDLEISEVDESVGTSEGNLISVRLNKVSLEEAIDLFAQLSGANIIVPELTDAAQISVNLKDVEWRPALQSILDTYSYELYQRVSGSNVFSVRRRPAGAPEPQVVETFQLNFATVPNAAKLVRDLLPEDAKVSEFASRNMLVVKSTESSLSEVRAVLESIDVVRQQVYIESKFMELTDDAQKDLGIDWSVLQAYGLGASGLGYDRSKTVTDAQDQQRFYRMDGTQFEDIETEFIDDGAGGVVQLDTITPTLTKLDGKSLTEVSSAVLSADDFSVVMSALENQTGINIVSNPKIIVANEEKANISIIRKEPNLKEERQQSASEGSLDNVTYELDNDRPFFDFGIKLDVTPSINTSSNITVQINPALTRKYGDKYAGENNTYPIIDEKSIQTVFNLADGQTAAIGGLTEVSDREEERKIPVLGSIPFLGRLFSWSQTVSGQDETIIFVTVGLANTQQLEDQLQMLPNDSELARRRVIIDANDRKLRDHGRVYFKDAEDDKLEDMTKVIDQKEAKRLEKREKQLAKEEK